MIFTGKLTYPMNDNFHKIFITAYPKLLLYARRLVGEYDADDIVQQVFIDFWKHSYEIKDDKEVQSILYRSIFNRSLNLIRHRKVIDDTARTLNLIAIERIKYYNPDRAEAIKLIEDHELKKKIDSAIERLPEKCRKAFIMSYLYNIPDKEIARLMDISVRTVEVHIYKALRILRDELLEEIS